MNLYAADRTFYEVTITTYTSDEVIIYNNTCSPPTGFTAGIMEISLFGSKDKLVYPFALTVAVNIFL